MTNSISIFSCNTAHEASVETNSRTLFGKKLQPQSSSRSTLQGGAKLVDIKHRTVKWELIIFSLGRTFDTIRCVKGMVGGFLSEEINRRSMVLSRTGSAYKYTRTKVSKISNTYIL